MKRWFVINMICGLAFSVMAQNHLLISEIQVSPDNQEFIEIFNPNPFPVSLTDYYLTDYNTYYQLVRNIFSSDAGDFLVKFPSGHP